MNEKVEWKDTLNLPRTDFPMKANLTKKEPEFLKWWDEINLFKKLLTYRQGAPLYVLHDGPPYANGHIHMGTALNKVLKDIIVKSRHKAGFNSPYVPGWDCHGLPIELNVEKELKVKRGELPKLTIRKRCREYAERWIAIQREEFKRLGVIGDWENPYLTMSYDYEATIAREFVNFLAQGSVYRRKKPVFWCPHCVTALAEAEVEYEPHRSPSIYVKFPLAEDAYEVLPDELKKERVFIVIWTTTPWTLPANLAIALNPEFKYVAVKLNEEVLILAEGRLSALAAELDLEKVPPILAYVDPKALEKKHAKHPFLPRESLLVLADYVTLEAGTGCVHSAPGHGEEDYETALKYGLDIYAPVSPEGFFDEDIPEVGGKHIFKANDEIIEILKREGKLLKAGEIEHSYPHCWRCKKPVIYRATEQWFISMEANNLRQRALEWIEKVRWIPHWGKNRIKSMIEKRPDWCLSRQRSWGVPLTVFICNKCGEFLRDKKYYEKVLALFEENGADVWFEKEVSELLPEGAVCPKCGSKDFRKEEDILDVWFDSGVSFAAVLERREELKFPANLYLEGTDQHRGWFHSSLLCAVGTRGRAPYEGVLTHGFVVDGQGRKMSKSLGNVIPPEKIIKRYGAEILRLWVAAEDYRDDIRLSDEILNRLTEAYRKIRNTCRFMLGNLFDFDPEKDLIPLEELPDFERYILFRLSKLISRCLKAYDDYEFHIVTHGIHQFCAVDLSAIFIDISRDTLYCESPGAPSRRAVQTVLYHALSAITRLMAPILSFTAEEIWRYIPGQNKEESVHLASFPEPFVTKLDDDFLKKWEKLMDIRSEITKALEIVRKERKIIGNSLEAEVILSAEQKELLNFLEENREMLAYLAIVSKLQVAAKLEPKEDEVFYQGEEMPELKVLVKRAPGEKCERCWKWSEEVGQNEKGLKVCPRCYKVLEESWKDFLKNIFS
ncbi:isoleucyl-tRNA synthetase [Thermodesulfatator indicus DSM 15286]|uniref:Isoleucine--tRNA ligase n=1 Tax=Thermodesulfatator indicus (strain DSM 15286 / JCM 11887 / CIR29812) TaxID=667014 RepID=F8A9M0_THEID|nr:isoleucine--tRNA ligase [Thermodesulfatator indicus]AEH45247.1 isoleucyl-tRNA synthetase [Thermodesulfatator indicus DSM 15286]